MTTISQGISSLRQRIISARLAPSPIAMLSLFHPPDAMVRLCNSGVATMLLIACGSGNDFWRDRAAATLRSASSSMPSVSPFPVDGIKGVGANARHSYLHAPECSSDYSL
jgi:hypothetical protein